MRRGDMDSAFRRVRDIRLALGLLLALSMTANLALTMSFAGRETVTVLVPATAGPGWEVGGGGANIARYALYWFLPDFVLRLKATPPSHQRRFVG